VARIRCPADHKQYKTRDVLVQASRSTAIPSLQRNLAIHRYNQVYESFSYRSVMTPLAQSDHGAATTSSSASQLTALLQSVGMSRLDQTGWIRITGEDRVRWLNGMVTNSIQDLPNGKGNYNFLLSVQGRIQGDTVIFAEPDALLMETSSSQIPALTALLDRFIIMDDVELRDVSTSSSGLLVAGPKAASLLAQIKLDVGDLETFERRSTSWNASQVNVIHAYSPLVPRFELWADPETIPQLIESLQNSGAAYCEPQSLEWLRILEGTPLYGADIRDRELPQETGQTHALHFAKGCYLGQEIVERIRSRGNVHRTFSAFLLTGATPPVGSSLEAEGKQVGELTSIAEMPLPENYGGTVKLALGFVRREALDRSLPLHYAGGVATPISSPFSAAAPPVLLPASESSERV
jgi:folate-binding protein YgfZ